MISFILYITVHFKNIIVKRSISIFVPKKNEMVITIEIKEMIVSDYRSIDSYKRFFRIDDCYRKLF